MRNTASPYLPRPAAGVASGRTPDHAVGLLPSPPETSAPAGPRRGRAQRCEGIVTFCQCCCERSLRKREVRCEREGPHEGLRPLAYLYACDACHERYLALTYLDPGGGRVEMWWYYVGEVPLLRRVARYRPTGLMGEQVLVSTEHFIGEEPVTEPVWKAARAQKRQAERARSAVPAPAGGCLGTLGTR